MRIFRSSVLAAVASGATAFGLSISGLVPAQQAQADELTQRLDQLLTDTRFTGSQVGLVVRDAATGEVLYDRNGGSRLLPASNMKLLTSAAAMGTLGPDFRFHTDALATAPVQDGKLRGHLYLKGYGDPTALESDYQALAKQVRAAGVRRIDGDLVADDSYFDKIRLGPFWSWDDEPFYYSAQTSALTVAPDTDYDSGTAIVESTPGPTAGAEVGLELVPETSALELVSSATTGAAGSANTLTIEREHGSNVVHVTGSVPLGAATGQEWVTVWEPAGYAADVFRRALRAAGVELRGKIRTGTAPASGRQLGRDQSMTVGELMVPFMKLSNNMHAEALVKTMGAESAGDGSWSAGLDVLTGYLQESGQDPSTLQLTDGSGLSRADYLTPTFVTGLLSGVRAEPWFQQWYDSLPIAGNPDRFVGGTLRSRMRGTPAVDNVHAKTGSLTGVTALSGYVKNADGRQLVFSMISNNYLSSPRSVEDAVAVTLASWSEQAAVPAITPAGSEARTPDSGLECSWQKAC